ncbi:axonemal dynein light chain domain-containing protein 1 [Protopterus annectens]|uniref:axonemal dynein light chain domain-containing protein 1 n=1 Tax=Protopterus annectens TaxID=7888 RepID=UPI001CFA2220|nr:axonemal dynein light chain domain-containing protein 1 [Protopterus annectens]
MSLIEVPSPKAPVVPKVEVLELKRSHSHLEANKHTDLSEMKNKPGKTENSELLTSLKNNYIPEEIFLTLSATASETVLRSNHLQPLEKIKTSKEHQGHGLRTVDHVWHHPARRTKFKHLTDQPVSLTRAGRDISFLCDAMLTKELSKVERSVCSKSDKSAVQREDSDGDKQKTELNLPTSVVPEEFYIVKNKGVLGLEYYDDKYTTLLEDDEKKLRVFPSMKPSGRFEVIQLMKVMETMLQKAGVDEEIEGPTQMHSLLDLVKKEQNIYNIIFHEVIRQVSVECAERGELLAKLRERYVNLLDRIPKQVKSLQTEVLAHQVMDRHLKEELQHFQNSIAELSRELFQLRERDMKLTMEVKKAQNELTQALIQAKKDANLLDEYHGLYQLQRHRLEEQVKHLSKQNDLWSSAALKLANKVIEMNNLHLAKKLYVTESSWMQLVAHFSTLLASQNVSDMAAVQAVSEQWKEMMTKFCQDVEQGEASCREKLKVIKEKLCKWQQYYGEHVLPNEEHSFSNGDDLQPFLDDVKHWEATLMRDFESFGGETLLARQETMKKLSGLQNQWTELGSIVFLRSLDSYENIPEQKQLEDLNETVKGLCQQWLTRASGENGLSRCLMAFANALEHWAVLLGSFVRRPGNLKETDQKKMYQEVIDCLLLADEALQVIGSDQREVDKLNNKPHVSHDVQHVLKSVQDWITAANLETEKEGARIAQEVTHLHTMMLHLLVNLLLNLVPDLPPINLPEAPEYHSASAEEAILILEEEAKQLELRLDEFSSYIIRSCSDTVNGIVKERKAKHEDDPEYEMRELEKIKEECTTWIQTCQFILSDLKKGPVQSLPLESRTQNHGDSSEDSSLPEKEIIAMHDENQNSTQQTLEPGNGPPEFVNLDELLQNEATEETKHESATVAVAEDCTESDDFSVRVIGHDENIQKMSLKGEVVSIGNGEIFVTRPITARSKENYDTLIVIENLQQQLLKTEEHAQKAEARAFNLDEQLREALEKIQALERQLKGHTPLEENTDVIPKVREIVTEPKKEIKVNKPQSAKGTPTGKQAKPKSSQKTKTSKS